MERTKRIANRLPEFYRTWDSESVIYKVVDTVGRALAEEQKSLFRIMRTHWVETANGSDLDRLGAIFELRRAKAELDDDYRSRIRAALGQFKGGGTGASIKALMADFLSADQDQLEISENLERNLSVETTVRGGDSWTLGSMSVEDSAPQIEIELKGDGNVVINPTVRNLDTGDCVGLEGRFTVGQKLVFTERSATLDGEDVSSSLVRSRSFPKLAPEGSHWAYEESITAKVGYLDKTHFDSSIFAVPVPRAVIRFTWSGRRPSAFALKVSSKAVAGSGKTASEASEYLNVIKGAGVQAQLLVME